MGHFALTPWVNPDGQNHLYEFGANWVTPMREQDGVVSVVGEQGSMF